MEKVWEVLNYPKEELVKDVMNILGVSKSIAMGEIQNGWIKPSSTKAQFRFYIPSYEKPVLSIQSEDMMKHLNGIIDTFIGDYKWLNEYHKSRIHNDKKAQIMTAMSMKGIWGKPQILNKAINEIKALLVNAEINVVKGKVIADKTTSEYHKLIDEYDLRLGRGIKGEWGTIRLILKWAERIDYNEYIKLRNSLKIEDWECMLKFETSLTQKRPGYEPIGLLKKDGKLAHLFQFDILKDVINGYDDYMADKLVLSAAWLSKYMFKYLNKADWLAVSTLWTIGTDYMWISEHPGSMVKPEKFRQEFSIPKRSFYRQRDKFKIFMECGLPGQPKQAGSIYMDPPTFIDIF